MKQPKPIKRATNRETSVKCPSCPHPVKFFSHFQPDGVTNKDFENAVLAWGVLTGANKLFPLHLPTLEKLSELAFAGNLWQGIWKRGEEPAWIAKVKDLPNVSKKTLSRWATLIREMIREEMKEFHLRPEWADQRNSCEARGRGSKGEIQNAILDDIISALKTVSPSEANQAC